MKEAVTEYQSIYQALCKLKKKSKGFKMFNFKANLKLNLL